MWVYPTSVVSRKWRPLPTTPLPIVEWALGPIARQIDAVWVQAPIAAALEAAITKSGTSAAAARPGSTPDRLKALRADSRLVAAGARVRCAVRAAAAGEGDSVGVLLGAW